MSPVVPSPALLNARLTSKKLALEEQLREFAKKCRDLEQRNASLSDEVEQKDRALSELRAHVLRLLGTGAKRQTLPPGQRLLFADATSDTVATAIEDLASPDEEIEVVELDADDVEIPDAEVPEKEAPGRRKPRDRKARKLDESNLRREVRRSELPPEERHCPVTGIELVETGVEVTSEVEYRPAELFIVEHHQAIYGPSPQVAKERTIEPVLAPPPERAVEGVTARPWLLAVLLCQKYVLHLPLYRQEDAFARLGVRFSRKTLCDWVLKSAFALMIVAREIERQI